MTSGNDLDCIAASAEGGLPVHAVRPAALERFMAELPDPQARFLKQTGFAAASQELALLADETGVQAAVLGLGAEPAQAPQAFGGLAWRLPPSLSWRLVPGDYDPGAAVLGYCLGAYRYAAFKRSDRTPARLLAVPGTEDAVAAARATWMVRDLINAPANLLGPVELADAVALLAASHGAAVTRTTDEALDALYPAVAAVGRGSDRPASVVSFTWAGSTAAPDAPLLSLCGKGVCFDTGGYDLKPSAGMLRMKKDMGGAAIVLGLARMIMEADLPIRLAVRIGCVENSVSGRAMRPLDIIRTRHGISVEVGNTDAEGRLVLCDMLAEAAAEQPALLVDFATLTGAARVALGPDLPVLFSNDDGWADAVLGAGMAVHDPLWRLPLWSGYASWLNTPNADIGTVSSKPLAGAIIAALFLQRFVAAATPWVHIDVYAWNDSTQPARPEGGEAQGMRALYRAITDRLIVASAG